MGLFYKTYELRGYCLYEVTSKRKTIANIVKYCNICGVKMICKRTDDYPLEKYNSADLMDIHLYESDENFFAKRTVYFFCSNCQRIEENKKIQEQLDKLICSVCKIKTKTKFCPNCGGKCGQIYTCSRCGASCKTKFCPNCGGLVYII